MAGPLLVEKRFGGVIFFAPKSLLLGLRLPCGILFLDNLVVKWLHTLQVIFGTCLAFAHMLINPMRRMILCHAQEAMCINNAAPDQMIIYVDVVLMCPHASTSSEHILTLIARRVLKGSELC